MTARDLIRLIVAELVQTRDARHVARLALLASAAIHQRRGWRPTESTLKEIAIGWFANYLDDELAAIAARAEEKEGAA